MFRSVRPLLLSLLSIAVISARWRDGRDAPPLFGELHLMTLVMSMVLSASRRTIRFTTSRSGWCTAREHSPWQSLAKVCNALLLALLTTVVAGYLFMMLAPLPRHSSDGGVRRRRTSASLDGNVLASVVVPWHAGPPGPPETDNAALAGRPG